MWTNNKNYCHLDRVQSEAQLLARDERADESIHGEEALQKRTLQNKNGRARKHATNRKTNKFAEAAIWRWTETDKGLNGHHSLKVVPTVGTPNNEKKVNKSETVSSNSFLKTLQNQLSGLPWAVQYLPEKWETKR